MNYYDLLGVDASATAEEIRTAYMKRAVRVHPDRNPSPTATREFQDLADAYYTLSDATRRADYDQQQKQKHRKPSSSSSSSDTHTDADNVFGDVFEDLLRSEVSPGTAWWSTVGMVSGATMGFIVANLPGAVVGGFAGKKIGSIRDTTGKPVYESFKELPHARKLQ
ncbi:hypothetical protein GGI21_006834, partial [Coemansia aciculifera]